MMRLVQRRQGEVAGGSGWGLQVLQQGFLGSQKDKKKWAGVSKLHFHGELGAVPKHDICHEADIGDAEEIDMLSGETPDGEEGLGKA